jgi:hypothetical protein
LEPCSYVHNGRAVRHKRVPDAPVDIDDFVAAFLGDKVRRVDPFKEFPKVDPFAVADPAPEDVEPAEEAAPEAEEAVVDDLPSTQPVYRRRRKRVDDQAAEEEGSDDEVTDEVADGD